MLVICAPPVVVLVDIKLNDEVDGDEGDGDEGDGDEGDGEINDEVDDEDEIWFAQCVKVLLLLAAWSLSAFSFVHTLHVL